VHAFVSSFVKPLTADIRAPLFARIPSDQVGPPDMFLSHAWNALLVGPDKQAIGTIDALARPLLTPQPRYVWIDFICYNQHLFETIAPDMEHVIGEIGRIGFVATPVPLLNRSWCLWELLCSERTGIASPAVFVHAGYRNDKILSVNALSRSFAGLERSESSSPRDRADILAAFQKQFGSMDAADSHIADLIREKLSDPMFELHGREEDLRFRPYPYLYDGGTDEAGRAAGIQQWRTFDPYYLPELRQTVLFGTDESIFDMLIDAGLQVSKEEADIRKQARDDDTVLFGFAAADSGDAYELTYLLDAGLSPDARLSGRTLLHVAAESGMEATVQLLLTRGADLEAKSEEGSQVPLHWAALNGHTAVVNALTGAGAAVDTKDARGATPLHMAADKGHLETVRLLLDRGANIEARNSDGWTALFWAAAHGHPEVVRFLLAAGGEARAVAVKLHATPLHVAASADVAELLLDAGADVNARASNGCTPLHYAVQNGHADVVRLLLDRGADPQIPTGKQVTLIEVAKSAGLPADIIARLR
jgi:ankyrin repeat protein